MKHSEISCIYHDINDRSWQAAEENCKILGDCNNKKISSLFILNIFLGGNLVSLNSPKANEEIRQMAELFHDVTTTGMISFNQNW